MRSFEEECNEERKRQQIQEQQRRKAEELRAKQVRERLEAEAVRATAAPPPRTQNQKPDRVPLLVYPGLIKLATSFFVLGVLGILGCVVLCLTQPAASGAAISALPGALLMIFVSGLTHLIINVAQDIQRTAYWTRCIAEIMEKQDKQG